MRILLPLFVLAAITLSNINTSNIQWIIQNSGIHAMLSDVVMLDSVSAIAVGRNGSFLRTSDQGETWVVIILPHSYREFWNAIIFFSTFFYDEKLDFARSVTQV